MCIGVAFSGPLHVLILHQMPLHLSTGLQVAAEGLWAFVFFHKHILATARGSHFAVKRCSRRMLFSECVPHARAGFVQSTRLHLAQASCRHRFLAFWLSFSPLSHKTYGEPLHSLLPCPQLCVSLLTHRLFQRTSTFAAPLRGSVCACSHEPGAGLRRPLLCCFHVLPFDIL